MIDEIKDYELSVWKEYSIVCDECGVNESTRDGNRSFAVSLAIAEGFRHLEGNASILCPQCLAKEPATAAAGN